jgi:hypothetical protein
LFTAWRLLDAQIIMNIIPSKKLLALREQLIEDAVSGLTIKIEAAPDGTPRLMIHGGLACGKREFIFDPTGNFAGTALRQLCCSGESLPIGAVMKASVVSIQTKPRLRGSYRGHSHSRTRARVASHSTVADSLGSTRRHTREPQHRKSSTAHTLRMEHRV